MTNDKERIEAAKWLFERTLGWIAAADVNVKVGVAIALDTAMLGGSRRLLQRLITIYAQLGATFLS